jgi:hypothetical protein
MEGRARAEWWFCMLALLPVLATASVYSEAFLASRTLGHWPIPSLEDPNDLPTWALHYVSAVLVLSTLPGAILVGAISLKSWRVFRTPSIYWVWIGAFVLSFGLFLWLAQADPRTWE